jgi:hypothetical protein
VISYSLLKTIIINLNERRKKMKNWTKPGIQELSTIHTKDGGITYKTAGEFDNIVSDGLSQKIDDTNPANSDF